MERSIKTLAMCLLLGSLFCAPSGAKTVENLLPPSPNLAPLKWFASTDPKHQNDDFFLLKPGETRRVPLAAGTLDRLWSTSLFPDKTDLTLESGPNRRQLLWQNGKALKGLYENKTFTLFPGLKDSALGRLEAGAALVVTNHAPAANKWFFQAAIRPPNSPVAPPKAESVARRLFKLKLAPGEEKSIEKWDAPGEIYEFSVASDVTGAAPFHGIRFKASFDSQTAVDAPLMSLAGQVSGEELIHNAIADFDGSRLVLRWPMPFQSAQIWLKNEGDKPLSLDIGARVSQFAVAPSPYRFCALESAAPTVQGKPVSILDIKGAGAFVGLALAIDPGANSSRRTFAYLEGNESITADGQKFEGTGTEDFFSSAWYFPDKPFSHPYEGLTRKSAAPPAIAAYRLLLPDAIPFQKSLHFDFEQGNGNSTDDMNWRWTAFWYQKPPLSLPASTITASTSSASPDASKAPVPSGDRWKLWAAVGVGVILGVVTSLTKRRRRTDKK